MGLETVEIKVNECLRYSLGALGMHKIEDNNTSFQINVTDETIGIVCTLTKITDYDYIQLDALVGIVSKKIANIGMQLAPHLFTAYSPLILRKQIGYLMEKNKYHEWKINGLADIADSVESFKFAVEKRVFPWMKSYSNIEMITKAIIKKKDIPLSIVDYLFPINYMVMGKKQMAIKVAETNLAHLDQKRTKNPVFEDVYRKYKRFTNGLLNYNE